MPISTSAINNKVYQQPHSGFNLEEFELNRVLNREFPLTNFAWQTSQALGTILGTFAFPGDLFDKVFIANKIQDFRLFKGGIRLSVRINAAQTLYGKLVVSIEPRPNDNQYTASFDDVFRQTMGTHWLVSASSGETAIIDLPFLSPNRAIDLRNYLPDEMYKVRITVLNPLTNATGAPSQATTFCTAQFLDAKLMIPHDASSLLAVRGPPELAQRSHSVQHPIQDGFRIESDLDIMSSSSKDKEATDKAEAGTISSYLEDAANIASDLRAVPIIDQYANTFEMGARQSSKVLKQIGLSKPTTMDMGSVYKVNPFSDLTYGKGIDTSIKLAMDPGNAISTQPEVGGISQDEMLLSYIVGTPSMVSSLQFIESTPATRIARLGPADSNLCFVDWVTASFDYYSGSYKYKLYITASRFQTLRGIVYLSDDSMQQAFENCYHTEVAINGDCTLEIMIPYVSPKVSHRTDTASTFDLWFQVVGWSSTDSSVNTPVYINTYKAGGSDFRFGALRETYFVAQSNDEAQFDDAFLDTDSLEETYFIVESNPRADFMRAFPPMEPSMTGYIPSNVLFGEEYTTLREILHRPFALETFGAGSLPIYESSGNIGTKQYAGLEYWGLLFMGWRGPIRYKLIDKDPSIMNCAYIEDAASGIDYYGVAITSTTNPLIEVEVPYYTAHLFEPTKTSATYPVRLSRRAVVQYLFSSAGDSFSFMYLTDRKSVV